MQGELDADMKGGEQGDRRGSHGFPGGQQGERSGDFEQDRSPGEGVEETLEIHKVFAEGFHQHGVAQQVVHGVSPEPDLVELGQPGVPVDDADLEEDGRPGHRQGRGFRPAGGGLRPPKSVEGPRLAQRQEHTPEQQQPQVRVAGVQNQRHARVK